MDSTTQITARLKTDEYENFDIRPLAGRIGAEILGLDLSQTLSDETVDNIRQALIKYKVIFFRRQQLTEVSQVAFARQFGVVTTAHPMLPSLPGHPEILEFDYGRMDNRTNQWHTDLTFLDRPPLASILRAVEIPSVGGDTLWANTVTAYQDLPAPLRSLANELWAVHSNTYNDYAAATVNISQKRQELGKVFTSTEYQTLHPVVRVIPESGERSLFIGAFVRQFRELSVDESRQILKMLQSYIMRPENTVRWRWEPGDIAFWDNRVTQHYGIDDFGSQPRRVQRVTIAGNLPVSIEGIESKSVKGDSSAYNRLNPA
ncbi:TauD/TfdA dioxygenase family protein [Limnoraphis robusta]|uniref:Alpha-ketoglutarate-dependent sulfate ester dioxygenase n=1 Tax=Limnoraphis robusta CS-951 TaxID=1637645 RepID=A0A0F5YIV5_9CYAN|nr:TauD/TfdA family dioxygenase [Limnoraphis robusta]KKD38826.1 taurine dioxygenase [Limnoraphis robusta CS-951]